MTQASNQYAGPFRTVVVPGAVASRSAEFAGTRGPTEGLILVLLSVSYFLAALVPWLETKRAAKRYDLPRLWDFAAIVGAVVSTAWVVGSQLYLIAGMTPVDAGYRGVQWLWFASVGLLLLGLVVETSGRVEPPAELADFNERLRGNTFQEDADAK